MHPRNIFRSEPLQPGMTEDIAARAHTHLFASESAALSGIELTATGAPATTAEEVALVARARAGDQDAFGTLVRLYQRQIFNLTLRMLRNVEEASEATQDIFLAAWQGLRGFRGDARFTTWLYRIAYNHCLRLLDQRKRDATARAELLAESAREHTPAGAISAAHAAEAERAMRETVRGEIANLPAKYRMVLVLRHLQELSYEEMAEVMRVPIGTVKTQLFRARALLKERLENLGRAKDEQVSRTAGLRAGLEAGLRSVWERGRELPWGGGDQ